VAIASPLVSLLLPVLFNKTTPEIPPVSEAAIRAFIKNNGIGYVGNLVRLRNRAKQCHAAHIRRAWFSDEDIRALDESKENHSHCIYLI